MQGASFQSQKSSPFLTLKVPLEKISRKKKFKTLSKKIQNQDGCKEIPKLTLIFFSEYGST